MAILAEYTYGGDIRATVRCHGPEGKTLDVNKLIPACQEFMKRVIEENPEYIEKLKKNEEENKDVKKELP